MRPNILIHSRLYAILALAYTRSILEPLYTWHNLDIFRSSEGCVPFPHSLNTACVVNNNLDAQPTLYKMMCPYRAVN